MRRILPFALLCTVPLHAQDDPVAAVLGSWDVKTVFQGRERPAVLELRRTKDGELAGTWKSISRDFALARITYKDGVLRFVRSMQGREIGFRGTVKEGKIAGVHLVGDREIPVTGRKLTQEELNDPALEFERNSMRAAPRDAFPVLDDPKMSTALEAKLADGEFVIGVVVEKEAKAYPVRVMGVHELLNDHCGGDPIAVSW